MLDQPGQPWARLFVVFGLLTLPSVALITPPYQVGDEIAHFYRADQAQRGKLVGVRRDHESGGIVDRSIADTISPFWPLILHPENKATNAMFATAGKASWDGTLVFAKFENTAIYSPVFYAFADVGIAFGKLFGLPVLTTFFLARLVNGFAATVLGAAAVRLAGPTAAWVFIVLSLPMALSEMASVSQDALMIPMAAAAAALVVRIDRTGTERIPDLAILAIFLCLIAVGRIAYAPLFLIPLSLRQIALGHRLIAAAAVLASAVTWSWIASTFALVQFGLPGVDAHGQVAFLLAHPARILSVALNTFRYQSYLYATSFIGNLGWLDVPLPSRYYLLASLFIGLAGVVTLVAMVSRAALRVDALRLSALILSLALLFGALYVSWTPVGNFIVDGIQGRYFIPLAFFVPCVFRPVPAPGGPGQKHDSRQPAIDLLAFGASRRSLALADKSAELVLMMFPFLTFPVVLTSLIWRYYL